MLHKKTKAVTAKTDGEIRCNISASVVEFYEHVAQLQHFDDTTDRVHDLKFCHLQNRNIK
jgi:hypothetical protein